MSESIMEVDEDGTKYWYLNGLWHREDGPAVECENGSKQWWLNDTQYTKEEYTLMLFFGG